ncbi:MAG: DNA polymerase III subunit chi [Porticoccaceae bacterium]
MTRVNFYAINGGFEASLSLACRLAEKAFKQNIDTLLFCADEASAKQLDELLWGHTETSFIPHQLITPAQPSAQSTTQSTAQSTAPIGITWGEDTPEHHGMLINLVAETPSWFGRFETLAEIVNTDPEQKKIKRERYSFYRDRGYPLAYHDLSKGQTDNAPQAKS